VLLLERLRAGELTAAWREDAGLLLHGSRIFVPDVGDLQQQALQLAHGAGHEGVQKTLHRLRSDLYIPGDRSQVQDWGAHLRHVSAQQDPGSTASWVVAATGCSVIDRFPKYAHFIALGHPYMAASVARAFFDGVVRLHGFPTSIVSDRDPVFTGNVWRDLFKMVGVTLRKSTAFHPQTDGQSEVVNKVIAMYLRCVTGDRPRAWVDWLSWAEYCYNSPSTPPFAPRRSRLCTAIPHRPSCVPAGNCAY